MNQMIKPISSKVQQPPLLLLPCNPPTPSSLAIALAAPLSIEYLEYSHPPALGEGGGGLA